jgi:hypothetical protein
MTTGRDILPTIENMYAFPIIAMMINVTRLRYLASRPVHVNDRLADPPLRRAVTDTNWLP